MHNIALLFTGQGSQERGMGRTLAENSAWAAEAMALWKKAERISGLPLRGIYWDGDEASMSDTSALQVALTVVNCTLWHALAQKCHPCAVAGHSLGEYSALAAARVLSIDSVLELTSIRGRLMADVDPSGKGGMAAVLKLDVSTVEQLVTQSQHATGEILCIANYNTPAQYVVSGATTALEYLVSRVKEHKGRALPLKVSSAFHSPLMQEAAHEFAKVLHKADWRDARIPIYCNVQGTAMHTAAEIRACMLAQMTSSVQWIATIQHMWKDFQPHFVECGPKAVLAKMVAPCLEGMTDTAQASTCTCAEDIQAFAV